MTKFAIILGAGAAMAVLAAGLAAIDAAATEQIAEKKSLKFGVGKFVPRTVRPPRKAKTVPVFCRLERSGGPQDPEPLLHFPNTNGFSIVGPWRLQWKLSDGRGAWESRDATVPPGGWMGPTIFLGNHGYSDCTDTPCSNLKLQCTATVYFPVRKIDLNKMKKSGAFPKPRKPPIRLK